ncbi:type II toxin-antitoxin system prevent-host-death family antitoxin [Streptomyces sp. A3M-1-3]|uniref:type II toxin-antitoxin system prevent-host-death family antitoxin n=1 Tax=Streptomyces sp. A3M-1-3 TaxID=2962044 RepID=UPI0020B7319D|nr:type II toxin-antitoxin system prevent-host-death family antitoxin [Streptomyces sp. A3M-1-3]MCP3816869.1 type II toxin-antitoxin system prevent-host-death family antitoxin [Streptomyces sp. A3M-1-3]
MENIYPLVEARNQLGQLVGRVRHGHEQIVISEYGKPAAALIPIEELEELRRLRDEADIAEATAREAGPTGRPMTHDDFMAQLDTEDGQVAAS